MTVIGGFAFCEEKTRLKLTLDSRFASLAPLIAVRHPSCRGLFLVFLDFLCSKSHPFLQRR